jgi:hypothetical protein
MPETKTGAKQRGEARPPRERDNDTQICPVAFCPIGLTLNTVNRGSPEVVEHLLVAGRELLLAAKGVIDSRAADVARTGSRLERIEIA